MKCENTLDGCTTDATQFVIGIDGSRRYFCEICYGLIAVEINRRLDEPKWRDASLRTFEMNNAVGNYLRLN